MYATLGSGRGGKIAIVHPIGQPSCPTAEPTSPRSLNILIFPRYMFQRGGRLIAGRVGVHGHCPIDERRGLRYLVPN